MNVVLGVGGGIAAYKAAELARLLLRQGLVVNTVLTRSGGEFVTPLTFAALTGRKVITDLFASRSADDILSSSVEHIQVAQENQVLIVAPATADLLAKFAHGIADDFLSTLYLAFTGPVVLAPAMNTNGRATTAMKRFNRFSFLLLPLLCGLRRARPDVLQSSGLRSCERRAWLIRAFSE